MRIFVDMDGTLAKWNNVEFEQLFEEGYYRNLEPNMNILNEVNSLINQGEDVYVLSAYLTDSEYAKREKQEWVKQYLPNLKEDKQIFVPYGTNKAEYLKEHYSPITNNDYLIDDYTKNLIEWKEYGGLGVKYLNGINHTRGTWNGLMIYEKSPYCNNTRLLNLILSEKLKDYGIDMIASYDGGGANDMSYACIYENRHYELSQMFGSFEHPEKLSINEIVDAICKELPQRKLTSTKNEVNDTLIKQYYSKHYPTLSKCDDFDMLCKELSADILDNIEYTVYLYEKGVISNPIGIYDTQLYYSNDYEFLEDNSRINISYIEWYEGGMSTEDLINECMLEEVINNGFTSKYEIENNEPQI